MKTTTYNVRLHFTSAAAAEELIHCCGQRSRPLPGLPFGDTYAIGEPVFAHPEQTNTLIASNLQLQASLTDLFPAHYRALTGQNLPALDLIPAEPNDMAILARLAAETSNSFAAMMQLAVAQLTREQGGKPLPAPGHLPMGMYITRCQDMNGHMLTLSFTQPDIFYPKDQVLGIDWGLTYLLSVAPADDINEVQYFTLSPAALDWIKRTPVSDGAEWQIMRAFTAKRLEPALAYIVQHGAVVRSEHIKTKHMDQGISAKLQKLGLIDFQRAILPQAIYTSGGRSERVTPVGTSVTCHKCGQLGERSGTTLTCPQHGEMNADGNAAIWIRRGGVASGC